MKKSYTWSGEAIQAITVREWCPWLPGRLRVLFHLVLLAADNDAWLWHWSERASTRAAMLDSIYIWRVCNSTWCKHQLSLCVRVRAEPSHVWKAGIRFVYAQAFWANKFGRKLCAACHSRVAWECVSLWKTHLRWPLWLTRWDPPNPHVNSDNGGLGDSGNRCLSAQGKEWLSCNGPLVGSACTQALLLCSLGAVPLSCPCLCDCDWLPDLGGASSLRARFRVVISTCRWDSISKSRSSVFIHQTYQRCLSTYQVSYTKGAEFPLKEERAWTKVVFRFIFHCSVPVQRWRSGA